MTSSLERLTNQLLELEEAIEAEVAEKRKEFRYRIHKKNVVFDKDVQARHRAAKERLSSFLARTQFLVVLTAPLIYMLILPLAVLDLFVSLYQAVCFPVYGIPKVQRGEYIMMDRHQLSYLNGLQKLNCVYCSYANGLIGWVREVASRTEAHWCPIKHAQRMADPHLRYHSFADFGDEAAYQEHVESHRIALRERRHAR